MTVMPPPGRSAGRRLLSTSSVARLVACDRSTVLRAILKGDLEAVRLGRGGSYRIAPESLDAWLRPAGGEGQPPSPPPTPTPRRRREDRQHALTEPNGSPHSPAPPNSRCRPSANGRQPTSPTPMV